MEEGSIGANPTCLEPVENVLISKYIQNEYIYTFIFCLSVMKTIKKIESISSSQEYQKEKAWNLDTTVYQGVFNGSQAKQMLVLEHMVTWSETNPLDSDLRISVAT